jgi:transposase InsO family protein
MVSLADRRRGAEYLEGAHAVSERRVCQVVGIARSTKRRPSGCIAEIRLVSEIHALSGRYPRFGYRKIYDRLKAAGWRVGREQVRLLRRREGLRVPQTAPKRRRRGTSTIDPHQAEYPNHVWSYDFVADQTTDGKTLRFLTVIDEFTRRALWIECARHLTSVSVVRVLEQLVELHGVPATIKSDNGPEFVAKKVQKWIEDRNIAARFIEPGSPWQNGHNESFNGVFRDSCLNRWLFESVREAREASEAWLQEYNVERPHGSLSGRSPALFFEQWEEQDREAA